VNGYSGNFPQARTPVGLVVPIYNAVQLAMAQQFPTEQLLCIMQRSQDVNTLVVNRDGSPITLPRWRRTQGSRADVCQRRRADLSLARATWKVQRA